MSMMVGGYYANAYIPIPSYAQGAKASAGQGGGSRDDGQNIIEETQAAQQLAQTAQAANVSGAAQPSQSKDEPQGIGAVEAKPDSQQMRGDSMDRRYSGAQMDMLDIQAAFFGFSSRRTADIPRVTMEEALQHTQDVGSDR